MPTKKKTPRKKKMPQTSKVKESIKTNRALLKLIRKGEFGKIIQEASYEANRTSGPELQGYAIDEPENRY